MQTCCTHAKQSQIPNRKITSASYQVNLWHYKAFLPKTGPSSRTVLKAMESNQLKIAASSQNTCRKLISEHPGPSRHHRGAFQAAHLRADGEELSPHWPDTLPRNGGTQGHSAPANTTTTQPIQRENSVLWILHAFIHTYTYGVLPGDTAQWPVCSFRGHQRGDEVHSIYPKIDT